MKFWTPVVVFALIALSCGGSSDLDPEQAEQLCGLANQVDAVFEQVRGERQLTAEERDTVRALVVEMEPLVPDEFDTTFRLRYWPNTSVNGLDTSGESAGNAYADWRSFRSTNC